jgi:phosphoglucomutase
MTINERFALWEQKATDETIIKQLEELKQDETAMTNAFYKDLSFGTAGMRGEIGAGPNCLNVYTIRKATQGVADYMKNYGYSVACISYDCRINSDLFMRTCAEVFAQNGIKAYVTRELMPTPFLSFITRYFKAQVGVMITASHNPAKYNGYKVYGADGCQLTDKAAGEVTEYFKQVDGFEVKTGAFDDYVKEGKIEFIGDEVIEAYLSAVLAQSVESADGVKVTYTALNGTGYKLVPEILRRVGVKEIDKVDVQCYPDGRFTTCSYPNPEKAEALSLALAQAKKVGSDIVIGTDPDADRIGTAVLHNGEYKLISGNEMGVLLSKYLLESKKRNGTLDPEPVLVKTIVSTSLVNKIAAEYGATVYNVLTGFKYIGDVIAKLEKAGRADRFVLGFEESYGYLSGTYVRDKDAVVASMLVAEMVAHYKREGKTLFDVIGEIYAKYGRYTHKTVSFEFGGAKGSETMKRLLGALRTSAPVSFAGKKVVKVIDYLTQTEFDLPKSNVISFEMEDGSMVIVRPSGTEPLIKVYITAVKTEEENKKHIEQVISEFNVLFERE